MFKGRILLEVPGILKEGGEQQAGREGHELEKGREGKEMPGRLGCAQQQRYSGDGGCSTCVPHLHSTSGDLQGPQCPWP